VAFVAPDGYNQGGGNRGAKNPGEPALSARPADHWFMSAVGHKRTY
jgi:hypothetical protein